MVTVSEEQFEGFRDVGMDVLSALKQDIEGDE